MNIEQVGGILVIEDGDERRLVYLDPGYANRVMFGGRVVFDDSNGAECVVTELLPTIS